MATRDDRGTRELIERALTGDAEARAQVVERLSPVIHFRVGRALLRRSGAAAGRDVRQEVEDFTQEVFAALFAHDGRVLHAWEPERGLTLESFAGLFAERQIASLLRTHRRSPWTEDPTLEEGLDGPDVRVDLGAQVESRDWLLKLLGRLQEELSPLGLSLFEQLQLQQRSPAEVCLATGMSKDAVYAWQSRLAKLARRLASELMSEEDAPPRIPKAGGNP